MNYQHKLAAAVLLAAIAGASSAQGLTPPSEYPVAVGKTRAEVRAELALAERDGDMLADGDSGLTEAQLHPDWYAAQRAADAPVLAALQAEEAAREAAQAASLNGTQQPAPHAAPKPGVAAQ